MQGEYRDVRYVNLFFTIQFLEDGTLPWWKASALRGGMGDMLLKQFCIKDKKCDKNGKHKGVKCDFKDECIVQRIMKSKMDILPNFMSEDDSMGFVFECNDFRTYANKGDTLEFKLILFGKNIVNFGHILEAFFKLGQVGIGKYRVKFSVVKVLNTSRRTIINDKLFNLSRVVPCTVGNYVDHRLEELGLDPGDDGGDIDMKLISPLQIKYKGEILENNFCFKKYFDVEALVATLVRRLYILRCYEGIEEGSNQYEGEYPLMEYKMFRDGFRERYSFESDQKMVFKGVTGEIGLKNVNSELLRYLLAGELLHIGRTTSFGLGQYRIIKENDIDIRNE